MPFKQPLPLSSPFLYIKEKVFHYNSSWESSKHKVDEYKSSKTPSDAKVK
jgi:hypothetical protein